MAKLFKPRELESGHEPQSLKDRTFTRGRGCWNCAHWDNDVRARQHWSACRQRDLSQMAMRAILHRNGEQAEEIEQARRMLNIADHAVARGEFGLCLKGKAGADMVHNAYLCDHWTGRVGASVATEGHAPDLLPEELAERLDSAAASAPADPPADEIVLKARKVT